MAHPTSMAVAAFLVALSIAPEAFAEKPVSDAVEMARENSCNILVTQLEKAYPDSELDERREWEQKERDAIRLSPEAIGVVNAAMKKISPETRKLYAEYEKLVLRNLSAHRDDLALIADTLRKELLDSFYNDVGALEGYRSLKDVPYCGLSGTHLLNSKTCIDDRALFDLYGLIKRDTFDVSKASLAGYDISLSTDDTNPNQLTISIYSLDRYYVRHPIVYPHDLLSQSSIVVPRPREVSSYTVSLTQLFSGRPIELSKTGLLNAGVNTESRAEYVQQELGNTVCRDSTAVKRINQEAVEDHELESGKLDDLSDLSSPNASASPSAASKMK